jgi:hypothetical protein
LPFGQAPHCESNKKKASARLTWCKNIKQGLWPFRTELWLARAWFAGQAFQSRHIKHALENPSGHPGVLKSVFFFQKFFVSISPSRGYGMIPLETYMYRISGSLVPVRIQI